MFPRPHGVGLLVLRREAPLPDAAAAASLPRDQHIMAESRGGSPFGHVLHASDPVFAKREREVRRVFFFFFFKARRGQRLCAEQQKEREKTRWAGAPKKKKFFFRPSFAPFASLSGGDEDLQALRGRVRVFRVPGREGGERRRALDPHFEALSSANAASKKGSERPSRLCFEKVKSPEQFFLSTA